MVGGAGGSHYSGFLPRLRIPYMSTVGERVMGKECFGFRIGCLGRGPQCICTVRERTGLRIFTKHTQGTSRHMWQRFGPAADTLHSRIARSTLGCRPHACVTLFPLFVYFHLCTSMYRLLQQQAGSFCFSLCLVSG